ncbi:MAG: hypothetical protein KF819_17975 [Labilithrix sp.]|nr:hypothetical protein [Labilithrix sp.]
MKHCGACNNACPRPSWELHATALCSEGKCVLACDELYADCNHQSADGCETSTADDPKNCGGCGNVCKDGELCWRGACGCPNGFTQCGLECKKLDSDNDNCGACGAQCRAPTTAADPAWICGPNVTPANTKWMCAASACSLQCAPGFGDCNDLFCQDGCEIDLLSNHDNCGACGNKCEPAQECVRGACICPTGTTRCGDSCVDLSNDVRNCGGCNYRCPGPSGRLSGGGPTCVDGECGYVCYPGYADCDGHPGNGCEAHLDSDPRHCGSCENKCNITAGQPCVLGVCLTRDCDAGVVN